MIVLKVRKANYPPACVLATLPSFSQLIPEVVRYPHFEVPYPQLKRGQQTLGALVAVVRSFRYMYGGGELCSSTQPCTRKLKFICYTLATLAISGSAYLRSKRYTIYSIIFLILGFGSSLKLS